MRRFVIFVDMMDSMNYKVNALEFRLKRDAKLEALRKLDMEIVVENTIETDSDLRAKRVGMKDVQDIVVDESFDNIKKVSGASNQQKLTQQNFNTQKKISQMKVRESAKKYARKFMKKVGSGIETSTTAFTFAQGGVDVAGGSDMIDKAEELRKSGAISEDEYDTMMRNGQLRVAQGSFGLANGVKNVGEFVGKRLQKTIVDKGSKAGLKLLKQAQRFAPVIGGMISMGTTATSIAKNAIAANDAMMQGNAGKAAMYGVMAAIDVITLILDGASLVTDFVFPPLSPIIDLVSTVLQVVNTVLGFFADLIDFRSTKQRVTDEFNAYINSDAFKKYVDDMAQTYKKRGFDVFTYIVDAEVAGIEADTKTLREVSKNINKCLTDKAKEDFNNPQHRIALLDATSFGKTLKGRLNNDEIIAGFGPDEIFGDEGDDMLFGRGGDDTIYGGPGNDYLNGGTGRDVLLGGTGDDMINCEPAVDLKCEGGEGDDTLELSGESLIYDDKYWKAPYITMGKQWEMNPSKVSAVKGIYLDMRHAKGDTKQGLSGISLGSLFQGWPDGFDESIHKAAIPQNSELHSLFTQFYAFLPFVPLDNWREKLENKQMWFLADMGMAKCFFDGSSMYLAYGSGKDTKLVSDYQNVLQNLDTTFAVYKNDRLQYTDGEKIKALLTFAFKRSFLSDKFEKVAGSPPADLLSPSNYIPTTIIGDNEHNVIDLSYGLGDVVYTNKGDNVVSVGTTMPEHQVKVDGFPDGGFKWAKYIVGGSGENTLIVQFMKTPESCPGGLQQFYQNWALLDLDVKLNSEKNFRIMEPHLIYAKNIKTVEVHRPPSGCRSLVSFSAKYYSGASRFILDETNLFEGPDESERDVIVLLRSLKKTYKITFGVDVMNTISFKYYSDSEYKVTKIEIGTGPGSDSGRIYTSEGPGRIMENARNVIGTPSCKEIIGNDKANLLMAVGGETTIDAKDGDDTLVSGRGRHILNGGKGADTYVIHGPQVKDVLTISVIMGDDGETIRCRTTIFGEWKPSEKRLEIDLLQDDHGDIVLASVEVIPAEGDDNKNLGSLKIDNTKRKLIFEPGNNFNDLERNRAKVIRVSFTTKGSTATIKEDDYGNVLRFESIESFDELKVTIKNDELVFKDSSDNIVFIDQNWKRLEHKTNLLDHILDFGQRFPAILFRKSDGEFERKSTKETVQFIYEQLRHIESELGQDYDSYIDSTELSSDIGNEIYVGNGENIVLAKTKGKTYRLGEMSSKSIIFANNFVEGSGKVIVKVADRFSLVRINTVVVGVGSGEVVELQRMHHNIIITGVNPDEVHFYKCGSANMNRRICAKDSKQQEFLILNGGYCQKLIFKKAEKVTIIMNCDIYLDTKTDKDGRLPSWPIIVSYGAKREYKLTLPIKRDESRVDIWPHPDGNVIRVYFKNERPWPDAYWSLSYLAIPTESPMPKEIDTRMLVNAMKSRFKGGIEFSDKEHINKDGICQLIVDLLKKHPPSKFTLTNQNLECQKSENENE